MDVDHRIFGDSMGSVEFLRPTLGEEADLTPLFGLRRMGHYGALCALECALWGDFFWRHSRKTA